MSQKQILVFNIILYFDGKTTFWSYILRADRFPYRMSKFSKMIIILQIFVADNRLERQSQKMSAIIFRNVKLQDIHIFHTR